MSLTKYIHDSVKLKNACNRENVWKFLGTYITSKQLNQTFLITRDRTFRLCPCESLQHLLQQTMSLGRDENILQIGDWIVLGNMNFKFYTASK